MTIVSSCTLVLHYWHKNVLSFRGGTKCSVIPRLSFSKGRREPGNIGVGGGGGGGVEPWTSAARCLVEPI